jgi:hypothetical protein
MTAADAKASVQGAHDLGGDGALPLQPEWPTPVTE